MMNSILRWEMSYIKNIPMCFWWVVLLSTLHIMCRGDLYG